MIKTISYLGLGTTPARPAKLRFAAGVSTLIAILDVPGCCGCCKSAVSPPKVGVSFNSCAGRENLPDAPTQAGEPGLSVSHENNNTL